MLVKLTPVWKSDWPDPGVDDVKLTWAGGSGLGRSTSASESRV